MPRLKQKLLKALENVERVAILGIGSELRADDAVGLLVLNHLQEKPSVASKTLSHFIKCDRSATRTAKKSTPAEFILKLFNGGTAPENLTGEIRRFKPGHLIMIDAVELGKRPGTIALLDLNRIKNTAFLTHKLPIKLMLDYLAAEMTFTAIFIGIQPRSLDFGGPVSKEVSRASRELADWLFLALEASLVKR